ncbi:MAG: DUF86 domain-containing protein [Rothia sp. (in: high G+C Gram-positive bacteria)]|uniref:HepT-like ribonuclease domain-containing protein n=1 Tax=Rothia sp. (in: high G+C Gram-positive bacteria) TaxID=1885016 RepID=UPI0026E0D4F2|nr:DUF86 domain-containing protein [Rothia sp. (in: high G+C Gram-positive bacteria)]MDO5750332.1 DUF86 domain-containing protein [Rothia sp. (in: high G+C Gram-positive bacteria)]
MTKSPQPYLILVEEALKAAQMYSAVSHEVFMREPMRQDAVCMRMHEAGENMACIRRGFPEFYAEHEREDWHRIIALRNLIGHGYESVSPEIIWNILKEDIPVFLEYLAEVQAL